MIDHMQRKQPPTIAIIGVYPPPLGGISVHIQRLCHVLESRSIPYVVVDGGGHDRSAETGAASAPIIHVPNGEIERWCLRYLFRRNHKIAFNHFLRWKVRFFLSLLKLKGVRVVHTVHSYRSDEQFSALERLMIRLTGWLSDHFIAVTDEIRERLLCIGIPEHKISVIPAFVPPDETKETAVIPEHIWDCFDKHEQVIVANGGVGNTYQGADLYGVDLCVEAFCRMAAENPGLGFIFSITHIVDKQVLKTYEKKLEEAGVADRFYWVHEQMPLYPLLARADLFVRPTASDGDALSIREALHYGTPVVASDAAKRPEGVTTFVSRSIDDFTRRCEAVLVGSSRAAASRSAAAPSQDRYVDQVIDIVQGR